MNPALSTNNDPGQVERRSITSIAHPRWTIAATMLASVGCALAPDLSVLLTSRALQGVGAAIVMPNGLGILGSSFDGEARGRAVGTWAAAGAIASAVGPPLGGWLVDVIGWRAIFYLNLPVAAGSCR